MKHLLFKEFYLGRKHYMLSLMIFLSMSVLGYLVRLSFLYGNLAWLAEKTTTDIDFITYHVFTYIPAIILFISACSDGGVTISDFNSHWMKYTFTTPFSEYKLVGIKFIAKIITLTISIALAFLNASIIGFISDRDISSNVTLNMFILFTVSVVFTSLYIPLSIILKSQNGVSMVYFAIISVLAIPVTLIGFTYLEKHPPEYSKLNEDALNEILMKSVIFKYYEISNMLSSFLPIIVLTVLFISFIVSIKLLKRRGN